MQVKTHLSNMANQEIASQMANGSDNTKSLIKLVQSAHILEAIESKVQKKQDVCSWMKKTNDKAAASA